MARAVTIRHAMGMTDEYTSIRSEAIDEIEVSGYSPGVLSIKITWASGETERRTISGDYVISWADDEEE